jgi:AcrR family transcriptional regulator
MAVVAPITRSRRGKTDGEVGARERILDAASRLFYQEGIQAVGIQRIIEEANTVKASLYAHFKSKDELVAAYLQREYDRARVEVEALLQGLTGRRKLLRLFDALAEAMAQPGFFGCAYCNASVEIIARDHPATPIARAYRAWWSQFMISLVREAGAASPEKVGAAALLLFEAAQAAGGLGQGTQAARDARWAVERLLDQGVRRK